jgi:hypothetical protein
MATVMGLILEGDFDFCFGIQTHSAPAWFKFTKFSLSRTDPT